MPVFTLTYKTHLKKTLPEVWNFFSNPHNLPVITPPWLHFKILGEVGPIIYEGQIIHYRVKPIARIPTRWVTEITHLRPPHFFIDEQRSGPYALWHHQHQFEEGNEGVTMTDEVNYRIGYGVFDYCINPLIIRPKIEEIFTFRNRIIHDYL